MKRAFVRSEDTGQRLAVIRPATRELAETAVAMASVAAKHDDGDLFQRIPAEVSDYTFAGYLGKHPKTGKTSLVDGDGHYLGELQRGDSFVDETDLEKMVVS